MVDIFSVTSPMLVRYPDGEQRLVVDKYFHPEGMVYTVPFWLESTPPAVYLVRGEIRGEGPWKIGDVIVRLLSCADMEQSMDLAQWQQALLRYPDDHPYHNEALRREILARLDIPG